jgi:replicative DNA helicase
MTAEGDPHDVGATRTLHSEQAVIGSLLLDPNALESVSQIVHATDFAVPAHRTIFATMVDLHRRGHVPDYLSVADELAWLGLLEQSGGRSYLLELAAAVPMGYDARQYAAMIA